MYFRFPNLVVGILTRDSVRQALRGGITAEQIIGYLMQHAHPQMLKNEVKQPLPPTVVDQIKLWELERNRLTYSDGVLYSQFLSQVSNQRMQGKWTERIIESNLSNVDTFAKNSVQLGEVFTLER